MIQPVAPKFCDRWDNRLFLDSFSAWLSGKSNPGGSGDKSEQPSSSKASESEYWDLWML